ncbi:hypothetical protein MSM1_13345 [Mycobacterium sp. SM1]|uniref:hypothetical protein n=1 Tax=Mycobacterium sp. SM1 TaxID=2816243 RepID=UPI001BCEA264|nr:hypothetical protein [Mycobacterium sp. SM1]MBS4729277.1 hypothetical protein [Mycobacterium sp. SM1]
MTEKFEFIDAKRAAAEQGAGLSTVARMCALLKVPKSGCYQWWHRPQSLTQRRREPLADKIATWFEAFGATCG